MMRKRFTLVALLIVLIVLCSFFAVKYLYKSTDAEKQAAAAVNTESGSSTPLDPKYLQYEIINYPIEDDIKIDYADTYLVEKKGEYEKQIGMRCGGYSSAYLLRVLGFDANGIDTYDSLDYVMCDGSTMPDGILKGFADRGISMKLYYGSIEQLKTRINDGLPLIVLIGEGEVWQHYLNIVGYDKENLYFVDSNYDTDNTNGYNRSMTYEQFDYLWSGCIKPFNNIYFYVEDAPEN